MRTILLILFLLMAVMSGVVPPAMADGDVVKGIAKPWQLNYQSAATPVMDQLHGVHNYLLVIITAVSVFVLGLLAFVCVRFRRNANPNPSATTHNTLLEIVWITVPVLILISIFIPSLKLHKYMNESQTPDLTLKVTGHQWYWGYEYPDHDIDKYLSNMKKAEDLEPGEPRLLAVDNPLVVPAGATVSVLLTGADVIHSFAIPSFGVKTDTIPGKLSETWFRVEEPGIYYGQCSELCGVQHGFMPIEVRAVEPDVFKQWVKRAQEGEYALDGLQIPKESQVASAPTDALSKDNQ